MTVYIVFREYNSWDEHTLFVHAVFSNKEAAKACVDHNMAIVKKRAAEEPSSGAKYVSYYYEIDEVFDSYTAEEDD